MPPREPIDLPDDFGLDDADHGHAISWMAGCFAIILIIGAGAVLWAVLA